jgi:aspartyl-tRNA(Asn)/glutamyl-tRNA(Gln) amidotransferase subunit C
VRVADCRASPALLEGELEADERKGRPDPWRSLAHVLCGIRVHQQLVPSPEPGNICQLVARDLAVHQSAIGRCGRSRIKGLAGPGQLEATAGAGVESIGRRHGVQYHPPVAGLTRADVEHVAFLARLRLTDEELDRLEGQLNHILDQFAKLSELDTSAIPPTAQTIELENILREDVARPSLSVADVLTNAPRTDGDFIIVPPILGGDGG